MEPGIYAVQFGGGTLMGNWIYFLSGLIIGSSRRRTTPLSKDDIRKFISCAAVVLVLAAVIVMLGILWMLVLGPIFSEVVSTGQAELRALLQDAAKMRGQ